MLDSGASPAAVSPGAQDTTSWLCELDQVASHLLLVCLSGRDTIPATSAGMKCAQILVVSLTEVKEKQAHPLYPNS